MFSLLTDSVDSAASLCANDDWCWFLLQVYVQLVTASIDLCCTFVFSWLLDFCCNCLYTWRLVLISDASVCASGDWCWFLLQVYVQLATESLCTNWLLDLCWKFMFFGYLIYAESLYSLAAWFLLHFLFMWWLLLIYVARLCSFDYC